MTTPVANTDSCALYVAHVFVVAALSTAAFMLVTAVELGPMGPLVIAEGLYLAAFSLVIELGLAARVALIAAKRAISRRLSLRAREA